MIEFLIRRFVPDWQQVQRTDVRERYGTLAAAVGILSNIFLCIIKGLIGLFSGSIAVTADAVNNLSDAGSSVITLLASPPTRSTPTATPAWSTSRAWRSRSSSSCWDWS